jgi:hypothetical protein
MRTTHEPQAQNTFETLKRVAMLVDRTPITVWRWAKCGLVRVQQTPYGALYCLEDALKRAQETNKAASQPGVPR